MSPPVAMMLLLLFLASCGQFGQGNKMELEKLVVIFRHGFRYPSQLTFKEGDKCASEYTPDQLGQLTPKGQAQMKHLGRVLRARYHGFLGNCANIQVQYAIINRTRVSADLVAQEICPKDHREIFQMATKLIGPLNTDPKEAYQFVQDTPLSKPYYLLQPTCEKQTQHDCRNFLNVSMFGDQIKSEADDDCPPPDWLTSDIQKNLDDLLLDFYKSFKCGMKDKYVTETADDMLSWIDQEFQAKPSKSKPKGFLMSLHDVNVGMVSSRIGIFNGLPVPLGAALVFELWTLQREQVVRTFYMNDTDYHHLYQLKIPNCSWDCPLNAFARATKKPYVQCLPAPETRVCF